MTCLRMLVTVSALVLTMGFPAPASAQQKPQRREQKREPKRAAKPDQGKVLQIEELKVEGRIQKPQAMFLMPRANLNVADLERSEPFLPKVVEALDKEPL